MPLNRLNIGSVIRHALVTLDIIQVTAPFDPRTCSLNKLFLMSFLRLSSIFFFRFISQQVSCWDSYR